MKILLTENQCREIAGFVIANYNQRPMSFEIEVSGSQIKIPSKLLSDENKEREEQIKKWGQTDALTQLKSMAKYGVVQR